MGFGDFLIMLFAKIFTVLSWPSFTLVCPLFASIRAIESDSNSKTQQCLAFWVLFALTTYLELALAKPFTWLTLWPQAKGLVTILLVIPYFGGASYVYKSFIRPCTKTVLLLPRNFGFVLSGQEDNILYASKGKGNFDGSRESEKVVICEEKSVSCHDMEGKCSTWPSSVKRVQQKWSCALCLVNMTSSKCLTAHLEGKKHKAKKEEFRADKASVKKVQQKWSCAVCLVNMTSSKCLTAHLEGKKHKAKKEEFRADKITKPVILCNWRKPKLGWTKLNTDGSIDKENEGLGGLLRDHGGNPICAFVSKSTEGDVFLVELWAIWKGLVLALILGIKVIWIESDSLSVVNTIKRDQPYCPKAESCLYHIWELLKKFDKYKVSHSWRETNRAADFLSKMVLEGKDVVLWPADFPESLHNIIKEDAQGKIYYRG